MALDQPTRSTEQQRQQSRPRSARVIVSAALLGLFLASGWLLWTTGWNHRFDGRGGLSALLTISRDIPPEGRYAGDSYVGPKVCAKCHPGEYALFTGSGHALTMRMASERRLSDQLAGRTVADPERPNVRWGYTKRKQAEFLIERQEAGEIERFVVDYALGSGHHATTFVTVLDLDPPRILEHRLTYYTSAGTLEVTPGQAAGREMPGTTPAGRKLSARETLKCLGCHATQLSAHPVVELDPRSMIPNVTCERCHGPGRAHVEAARGGAGAEDLAMPMGLERWTVQSQLELCGNCHRHPSRVPPAQLNANDPVLARFQPIGLSQSRCFSESKGKLSCISCHDPHARSSSDPKSYERVCLSCHEMPRKATTAETGHAMSHLAANSVCPVSPSRGCVACHMPGVDSGQHVLFTDHWIRIRRPALGP